MKQSKIIMSMTVGIQSVAICYNLGCNFTENKLFDENM